MNHALYFIGAGLTKSLQKPKRPVPMMNDFISVMADYVDNDVILLTLAHLEMLKDSPYSYKLPGMADLARRLYDSTDRSPQRRARFKRALKNRPAEGIEQLLEKTLKGEKASPDSRRSAEVLAVRFRHGISKIFEIIGWDVSLSPLKLFLDRQLARAGSHTFVSFNYDLVLDYALSKLLGRPDLEALYGLGQRTGSDPLIKLVKPHGSLNFIGRLVIPYGDPGPYGHPFETKEPEIPRADSGDVCYWDGGDPTKEPCIVPPVASKPDALKVLGLTFLDGIRDAEKRAISSADEVYIIGWSIPQTDEDQREMIRESIRGRTLQQLVVVNRGAPPAYFFGVADLFGVDIKDMKIYNNGFCDYVEEIGLLPQEEATR
jgi:hypothetical protein